MKYLILPLLFINFNLILCQSNIEAIPSIKNNLVWLNNLEEISSKENQLKFVIDKIRKDSIYKNEDTQLSSYISESGHLHTKFGEKVSCKIIFVLNNKKQNILLDLNKTPKQSYIINNFNSETIDRITILKGLSATSLLGIKGNCGAVYIEANKRFRKLNENN